MYVKGLFETFRILGRLGIKPKDVLGLGGDVVKMGKSLFNTKVNPKLLQFIEKNQQIPTKIIEQIKIHARTLKNASENQKKLFEVNIRDILNAKTPKPPVTSVQRPATSVKEQVTADFFKGWTPRVIKGGKDGLATGGIAAHFRKKFDKGSDYGQFERRQAHNVAAGKHAMNVGGGNGGSGNNNTPIINVHTGPTPEEIEAKKKIEAEAKAKLALQNSLNKRKKKIEYYDENIKKEFDITPIAEGVNNAAKMYNTYKAIKNIKNINPYAWLAGKALKKLTNYKK